MVKMGMLMLNNNTMFVNNKIMSSTPTSVLMSNNKSIMNLKGGVSSNVFSMYETMAMKNTNCKSCGH